MTQRLERPARQLSAATTSWWRSTLDTRPVPAESTVLR